MSITDELREYANGWSDRGCYKRLIAIADRIDEAHAKARDKAYDMGVYDGIDADKEARGYIKLPVDDDGVPIRIGDTMEWLDGSTAEVIGIGNGVFFYKDDESDGADWSSAENKRHHHEPTVEDVLREFAERYLDYEGIPSAGRRGIGEALMDEYAAKLRLAGDE